MKSNSLIIFIWAMAWLGMSVMASPALAESLEPPVLLEIAEASRPSEEERGEVRVGLRITVDAEGAVTQVEVLQSAGETFDSAARDAVLRARFAPARRDGVTIPARIGFEYVFPALPPEAVASDGGAPVASEASTPPLPPQAPETSAVVATPLEPASAPESDAKATTTPEAPEESAPPTHATVVVRSRVEQRRRSVEAVDVVDLAEAKARTADLGEVLARTEGVTVRRSGGLGSSERISLVGFEGRQVRYFLDGIPLRFMGFGMGVANVPVGLVERLEIYRGVVPIRYGADALGGAIDLVSDLKTAGHRATASYQTGSFGTQRLSAAGRVHDARTGVYARGNAHLDYADNNYTVDASVADSSGLIQKRQVDLRNANYRSYGAALEAGVADRKEAKRATLRGFFTDHEKGIPHNIAMTVPYGDVRYGQADRGLVARYENDFLQDKLSLSLVLGFLAHRVRFVDQGECTYDWFAQCVRTRNVPGEMSVGGRNIATLERSMYLRSNLVLRPWEGHAFTFSLSPELDRRETERSSVAASTLTGRGARQMIVGGAEYELTLPGVQNSLFGKLYAQRVTADEHVLGDVITREIAKTTSGVGDSLRFDLNEDVYLKASYEWATRMPGSDEYFGDGVLTVYNYGLLPERSHNLNLSLRGRLKRARVGVLQGEAAFFARRVRDLIWLTASADSFQYQNVGEARSLGATANATYRSPGDWVDLRASATYQDFRNISDAGIYADVRGDRIPNRPYLEGSGEVGFGVKEVVRRGDRLSALWGFRYVHAYFLAYESRGKRGGKLTIPTQFVMHAALRYVVTRGARSIATVLEAHNLANVAVYDFFGVQRPRRAVYAKLTVDF